MDEELPDALTVTLRKPVTHGDATYTELTLREPIAGELQSVATKNQEDAQIFLIATISGVPEAAVAKIGTRDLKKAQDFLLTFTPADDASVKADPETLPEDLTIELRKPLKIGDMEWSELRLREPTGGEMQQAAKRAAHEAGIFLLAKVSGLPDRAIKQVTARDFNKATAYLLSFT